MNDNGFFYKSERSLLVHHLRVKDISQISWKELKEAGFEGVVFDRDNTLTKPYSNQIHPPLKVKKTVIIHIERLILSLLTKNR